MDNLLLVLRTCKLFGPYREAAEDYEEHGTESQRYQEYILEPDYMSHYGQAVQLSAIHITALYEVYELLKCGGDFSEKKNWFLRVVHAADLSCPLQTGLLDKAYAALSESGNGASQYARLFAIA